MQRVCVIGDSGSGKTTLGRWLADRFDLPFTDLDDLHWLPGWIERDTDAFRTAVDGTTCMPRWVVAGNYSKARDLLWPRADTLICLDLPLAQVLWRSASRALRQCWTAEPICNGNRQTLAKIINGGDSLLGYTLHTYRARRREWSQAVHRPEHQHLRFLHLHSVNDIARWQASVQSGNTPVER